MAINPTLRELKKALGADYRIYNIDLERCLYRDYGNGFDVEISDVSRANRKCPATLYLWFTGEGNPMIVKTVHNVGRTADAIAASSTSRRNWDIPTSPSKIAEVRQLEFPFGRSTATTAASSTAFAANGPQGIVGFQDLPDQAGKPADGFADEIGNGGKAAGRQEGRMLPAISDRMLPTSSMQAPMPSTR